MRLVIQRMISGLSFLLNLNTEFDCNSGLFLLRISQTWFSTDGLYNNLKFYEISRKLNLFRSVVVRTENESPFSADDKRIESAKSARGIGRTANKNKE